MPVKDHKTIGEQHAEERRGNNAGCPNCYKDGIADPDHDSRRICDDRACPVVTFDWIQGGTPEIASADDVKDAFLHDPDDQPCGCDSPEYSTAFTEGVICLSCGWKGTNDG